MDAQEFWERAAIAALGGLAADGEMATENVVPLAVRLADELVVAWRERADDRARRKGLVK